ncbi:hypothetical protein HNQ51_000682 [Inhella inkyongensis]|uniref:Solute-binding protein family 3/N-terminal domain-containing protein n=1 Tax=Inhella inkyongensis TaxID=392593 RepID=A0A840S4F6_9BURK|nr:transporter substrate-binding domain-containing protein [Inhella inkyongensis]MBB5203389.1 hypothetical protein [Inhella inkyongensis]
MKAFTRRHSFGLGLGLSCALAGAAHSNPAARPLRIGSFGVTPYVMDAGRGPIGALVDYFAKEVAPHAGLALQWQSLMTVPRLLRELQEGGVDCCPMLTATPERFTQVRFAAQSHWRFESVLALRPDHPLADKARLQPEDLDRHRIGWIQGSPLPPELERPRIQWDLTSVLVWERSILTRVARGQLDGGYFSNPATPAWHARAEGLELALRPLDVPIRALYTAFSPRLDPAVQARIEAANASHAARLETYLKRWLA